MKVTPVNTPKILPKSIDLFDLLNQTLPRQEENTIVAITSKIISLCEGRVIPMDQISKEDLIKQESEYYLPAEMSQHGHHFTIAHNIMVASAGADESNGDGNYVLWPDDPQKSANDIRKYLKDKHNLKNLGVIITDSVVTPLRRGTTGIALSYSGFVPLHNYIGQPDLFGRPFSVTWANIADGLAAAAVVVMGEGTEQTPIAVLADLPFVKFESNDPTLEELAQLQVSREEDLFAPFLNRVEWLKGDKN